MEPGIDSSTRGWPVIFQLIGVDHRSAPEDRERFAIPEARLPDARLVKFPGGEEALVVSTCNRTNLLARSRNGSLDLRAFLADYLQVPTAEFEPMSKAEYAPRSFQSPFPEVQTLAGC